MMNGHHGQRVLVDRASQTVLVQTALSHEGPWQRELFALFEGAIATAGWAAAAAGVRPKPRAAPAPKRRLNSAW